jgi:phage host-nuclease inhibitor protein Gam
MRIDAADGRMASQVKEGNRVAKKAAANKATKPVAMLGSWDEADTATYDVAVAQLQIEEREAEMNRRIAEIQAEYSEEIKKLRETHDEAEAQVLAFAEAHKEDFGGAKSKKLSYGTLSFSKSDEKVEFLIDETIIIANLRKKNLHEGVVRSAESIDKNVLPAKVVDPEQREKLGFRVVPTGGKLSLKIDRKSIERLNVAMKKRATR